MTTDEQDPSRTIVLFDGVCNLCNASVRFIITRDRRDRFRFAPLQSAVGKRFVEAYGLREDLSTFFLIDAGRVLEKSDAWLRIIRTLGLPWSTLFCLAAVPRPLRNWLYDFVGKHRYRWFGRQEHCPTPAPRWQRKFLQ